MFSLPSDDLAVLKGSDHSPRVGSGTGGGQGCVHPMGSLSQECRAGLGTTHPPCIPAVNPFLFPPKCSHFGGRSRGATSQSTKLQTKERKLKIQPEAPHSNIEGSSAQHLVSKRSSVIPKRCGRSQTVLTHFKCHSHLSHSGVDLYLPWNVSFNKKTPSVED